MKKLFLTLTLAIVTMAAMAVPAKPGLWRTLKLSNGTEVRAQLVGDEHGHWLQAADGTCYVEKNGIYEAVELSDIQARREAKLAKRNAKRRAIYSSTSDGLGEYGTMSRGAVPSIGEFTIPVVMVQFSDLKFKNTTTVEKMTRYYNEEGYKDDSAPGSVRDYFKEQSAGQFVPKFDVVGIVTLSKSYKYYGGNDYNDNDKNVDLLPGDVIDAAIEQLGADFSQYVLPAADSYHKAGVPLLAMFYAGPGEATENNGTDYLWPCEWDDDEDPVGGGTYAGVHFNSFFIGNELNSGGQKLMGMSVFCHEFGHALGLPDFYCTDYSYNGDDPFGFWSIMDSGSYLYDDCRMPSAYNAYEKSYMGWLKLVELDATQDEIILANPENCAEGSAVIVRNSNTETFILENHQPSTFFPSSYGSGVLVMRIAYSKSAWSGNDLNNTKSKKRACVLTADGAKMYYSADKNNLYGYSKTAIGSLKTYSGSTKDMGIKKVTKNNDGTITLTLNSGGGGDDPVVPQGDVLFNETFDKCKGKGGNDGQWNNISGAVELDADNDGWSAAEDKIFAGDKCARFGTGSIPGSATSPSFTVDGEAMLTFKAGAWDGTNDGTDLKVSVPSGFTISELTTRGAASNEIVVDMVKAAFTDYMLTIKGTGNLKLTFAAPVKGRFFLDEVKVQKVGSETGIVTNTYHPTPDNRYYTLDGRVLNGVPTQKGIYIFNGKKVLVK